MNFVGFCVISKFIFWCNNWILSWKKQNLIQPIMHLKVKWLIFLGGIGFSVLVELQTHFTKLMKPSRNELSEKFSWHSKTVLQTSIYLVVFGWVTIYLAEFVGYHRMMVADDAVLTSLFQFHNFKFWFHINIPNLYCNELM